MKLIVHLLGLHPISALNSGLAKIPELETKLVRGSRTEISHWDPGVEPFFGISGEASRVCRAFFCLSD